MKPGKIRPLALCVFLHEGKILVTEYFDRAKQQVFYRPPGGGIKFGEYSREAATREIREEMGAEMVDVCYLGTIENVFIHNGEQGHEIVLLYRASFADPTFYDQAIIEADEEGEKLKMVWKPLAELHSEGVPLYPTGLFELLSQSECEGIR